nr:MAG TPA: Dynactin p62 family [Caudoviricetes sp.]
MSSPNSPTPRTFQLLGCGQREDSDPAVFFVLSQRKTLKKQKSWVIIFCSFGVFCWPCHSLRCPLCPPHQIKIPYICNTIQAGVSRYLAALNQH